MLFIAVTLKNAATLGFEGTLVKARVKFGTLSRVPKVGVGVAYNNGKSVVA